jgi:hypothetical protein
MLFIHKKKEMLPFAIIKSKTFACQSLVMGIMGGVGQSIQTVIYVRNKL